MCHGPSGSGPRDRGLPETGAYPETGGLPRDNGQDLAGEPGLTRCRMQLGLLRLQFPSHNLDEHQRSDKIPAQPGSPRLCRQDNGLDRGTSGSGIWSVSHRKPSRPVA